MMMNRITTSLRLLAAVSLCSVTGVAGAAEQWCAGKINETLLSASGQLLVHSTWRNDWTMLCGLKESFGGIDVVTCSHWVAMVAQAVEKQLPVLVYYTQPTTCATQATYGSAPVPHYFRIMKP